MCKILGYGEDAFTLWALKHHLFDILGSFQDQTAPSDCLILYRPSFGRTGGKKSAEFGEFDAIIASLRNVYLVEGKWDNLSSYGNEEITIKEVQELRHSIFSWYLAHWDEKYVNNWEIFVKEHRHDFQNKFQGKTIPPTGSLLAANLEFILDRLLEQCKEFTSEDSIKNVLLFFYNKMKSRPPSKVNGPFKLVSVDYSQEIMGNFIPLG